MKEQILRLIQVRLARLHVQIEQRTMKEGISDLLTAISELQGLRDEILDLEKGE